jgi:hypothetical protein
MDVFAGADRGWEIWQTRALVGYILIRRLGYKLKDVAKCLVREVATVSSLVSRFTVRMGEKPDVEDPGCSSTGSLSRIESPTTRLQTDAEKNMGGIS